MSDTGAIKEDELQRLAMVLSGPKVPLPVPSSKESPTDDNVKISRTVHPHMTPGAFRVISDIHRDPETGNSRPMMIFSQMDVEDAISKAYPGAMMGAILNTLQEGLDNPTGKLFPYLMGRRIFDVMTEGTLSPENQAKIDDGQKWNWILSAMQGRSFAVQNVNLTMLACESMQAQEKVEDVPSAEHAAAYQRMNLEYTLIHEFFHHRVEHAQIENYQQEEVVTDARTFEYMLEHKGQDGALMVDARMNQSAIWLINPEALVSHTPADGTKISFESHPVSLLLDVKDGKLVPASYLGLDKIEDLDRMDKKVFEDAVRSAAFANLAIFSVNKTVEAFAKDLGGDENKLKEMAPLARNYAAARILLEGNDLKDPVTITALREYAQAVERAHPDIVASAPLDQYRRTAAHLRVPLEDASGQQAEWQSEFGDSILPQKLVERFQHLVSNTVEQEGTAPMLSAQAQPYAQCKR